MNTVCHRCKVPLENFSWVIHLTHVPYTKDDLPEYHYFCKACSNEIVQEQDHKVIGGRLKG